MAYLLKQGNKDCLSGEVLVYAKCLELESFPAMFFSTDNSRIDKFAGYFGDATKQSIETSVCATVVFPSKDDVDAVQISDVVCVGGSWLKERAVQKCMSAGSAYMAAYFSQIKHAYGLDFDESFVRAEGRQFARNIEAVIKALLDDSDARKTNTAASVLRLMADKSMYAELCKTIVSWNEDSSRPVSERKRIILATKDRIIQEEKERRYWEWT